MKKYLTILLAMLVILTGCTNQSTNSTTTVTNSDGSDVIVLNEETASLNGTSISEYDYTWNIDPSKEEPWYEGDEPSGDIYIAHDIIYYPELDEEGFSKEVYDDETEYVYHYTADGLTDYVFSTLPVLGDDLPSEMMHSAEEAYENKVLHICKAGTYTLQGTWHGQILIDLGDDAFTDENAKVTLILNGVDITCDVASGIIFKNVYEADNTWEEREEYSGELNVGEMETGATIVIADETTNNVTGANVYRLLKPEYKKEGSTVQKKYYKVDGAFYSCMSMNINGQDKGNGVLNITSTTFEGLDTELHLAINSGIVNIHSQDDGININEDNVSVLTINGGRLNILAGLGAEGDGIDSNGYVTINGGEVYAVASPYSDNGIDSEDGTTINGGTVVALGSNMGGSSYSVYIDGEQQYQESNTNNMFGGMGGGQMPGNMGDFDPSQMGDFDPSQFEGTTPPEKPDGNFNPNQQAQN